MKRNVFLSALAIVFFAIAGMGSDCDPGTTDGDGGTNGDGGGGGTCRDMGTCDPNKYSDTDQGDYDTTNYGFLFLDTTGNGIPDTPDTAGGDIVAIDAKANDADIEYWLLSEVNDQGFLVDTFAAGDTFLNRVYIMVDDSNNRVGWSVIDEVPDGTYSPLFQAFLVHVPAGYTADTLKSEATIMQAASDDDTGIWVEGTNWVYVIQIVDQTVGLAGATTADDPELADAWYNGSHVYGYAIPGGNTDGTLPTASESADPDNVPPDPYLSDLWQFREPGVGACGGQNVYLDVFGGALYSPVPVLHPYDVPSCATVATNADDVITAINDTTYTPHPTRTDIVVVTPQKP